MFRHRSNRTAAALVGVALAATACASTGEPGVEVQALQADVVFGVELPAAEDPVPSPSQLVPEEPEDRAFDDGSVTIPFRNRIPERFQDIPFRTPAPQVADCPTAPIGASPSEAAPEEVGTLPPEGMYSWKRDLSVSQTLEGVDIVTRKTGFENRIVRDVEVVGEGTDPTGDGGQQYTYQTVRPDGFGQVLVESFRVNTEPIERGANSNVDTEGVIQNAEDAARNNGVPAEIPDEAQEQVPNPNRVRVGEPNRGLILTEQQVYDGNGVAVGSFAPSPPALLLPLPVEVGDAWTSTSTDPGSGQTMRISGEVNERETVDACGTLLDGWRAELEVTIASADGTVQRTTELIVSTSLGAMIIGERSHEEGTDAAGRPVTIDAEYGIAQTEPDPVPEDGGNP